MRTPEENYKLTATLAAYHLLIRELLVLSFGRQPNAVAAIGGFKKRLLKTIDSTTFPLLGAPASDLMSQEIAEATQKILDEAQSNLTKLLSGSRPRSKPPTSSPT